MRTDHLITVLSQDQVSPPNVRARTIGFAGITLLLVAVFVQMLLGWRPNLIEAMQSPVTMMKWLLPLAAAIPAMLACLVLIDPQTRRTPIVWISVAAGIIAVAWLAISLIQTPSVLLWPEMHGKSMSRCLISVILISVLPLAAALWWLREGASPSPLRSGALAGLAVGGLSAAIYASFCDEDAPLFFLTWYGLAIIVVTLAGAVIGKRVLRW